MAGSMDELIVPLGETAGDRHFLEHHIRKVRRLIVQVAYWHGHDSRQSHRVSPNFKELWVSWTHYYGCLDVSIHDERNLTRHDLRVFGRNEYLEYSRHFDMQVATYTDGLLACFLPGIRIVRSIRQCAVPIHFNPQWPPLGGGRSVEIDLEPRIGLCKPKGERWVCLSCEERYELPAEVSRAEGEGAGKTAAERERGKMTAGLRFEVLERCRFSCGLCGRSTLKGDDIKLHVDHIVPIAKGGKTEAGNLWALCQECNLGKSDRLVGQLSLGLKTGAADAD